MSNLESFELVGTVEVALPADYNHDEWLRQFMEKRGQEFVRPSHIYEKQRTSFMDEKVTTRLVPNQYLVADFYDIKTSVNSYDCLGMIAVKNGLLLGTRGAALLCAHATSALPKDDWCFNFSFNAEESMPMLSNGCESNRCIPTLVVKEKPRIVFVDFDYPHDPKPNPYRPRVIVFHAK